jgi:Tol biopolymer transport system component
MVAYVKSGDVFLQSATGQTAINLTKDSPENDTMPAFSPDGESIAFRSDRAGGGIFVMGRTGESVRRVTARGFYPSWFPDGRRIIFSTDGAPGPESLPATVSEIVVADVASGDARTIVSGKDLLAMQPRVSPHSRRIAYWAIRSDVTTERYNRDIWTVDLEGKNPVRATTHVANDWNPVWSPDGRWLYFLSNRAGSMNLWRVAIDEASGRTEGEPQPLTTPASYVAYFCLSGDGRVGAYAALVYTGNLAHVAFDAKNGVVKGPVVAITTGTHDFMPSYEDVTPDGRFVVAATSSRGQEDLFVLTTADGSIRQLTKDFYRDRAPRWSPDGSRVFFYSDRGGSYELWSIDADGGGLRQLTNDSSFRGYPLPSRDGTRMIANDIDRHLLFVYDPRDFSKPLEQLPALLDPAISNPMPTDWTPDGRQILYTGLVGGSGSAAVWTYAFGDRTHRRVTAGTDGKWLLDGRRFLYVVNRQIRIFDTATGASRDVLSLPGEAVGGPRLAAPDSELFFSRSAAEGDISLVRFDPPSR